MTPGFAVGMGTSIRVRILEKNRWWGKAMFTASHESFDLKGYPRASRIMQVVDPVAYNRPSTS